MGVWRILEADYDLTDDHENYLFYANGTQPTRGLSINGNGSDSPMRLKIMEPLCGENLTLNQARDIKVNVSDIDDIVTGTLSIDGTSWNVTNGISTFGHTFNKSGNIKITLTGTNTRGQTKTAISNIMVVDTSKYGVYIAACIDRPEDYEDIKESTVVFNATSTRAFQYFVGGTYSEFARSDMTFMWTFSDGRTNPNTDGTNPLAYLFHKTFIRAGDNWAELRVEASL